MMLLGRTALVTGAASGIGLAIAKHFAAAGCRVVGLDKKTHPAGNFADYPNITHVTCDLTHAEELEQALSSLLENYSIDILVNNAGINPSPASLTGTSESNWLAIIETNLTTIYRISKLVLPRMEQGVVINIGSILGMVGARENAAYAATKAAIISLTKSMALDYGPDIRVNCVCPGAIQTEMFETYVARCTDPVAEKQRIVESLPMRRLGTPDDVANAVLFFASEQASWITGQILAVDGGDST